MDPWYPLGNADMIEVAKMGAHVGHMMGVDELVAMLDTVTETLRRRDAVTFTGFGKFSTSARAARMGVNPRTGAKVMIPATTVPKFSAGSSLKTAVKGG
jgi:DNA-binding protein HU-beta